MKSQLIAIVAVVLVVGCGPPPPDISIHNAAGEGNIEAVKQHIAAGTDVDAKTRGETPLLWAARFGQSQVAELLIAEGADVNAKNVVGQTPLHWAAMAGHKEIIELLIAVGAEVNAKTKRGETPLDLAEDDPKIRNPILKHGGKMGADLGY
ncbi:ankyrin repeat domain-containing protein [bacterium]|nr:ankyrin repeat domain-containing protein [bacterium]